MNVEERYRSLIQDLTPKERVARAVAMACWTRNFIARQIQREKGPLSLERLKWEVALRLYGSEPGMRTLIEERLERVSD